MMEKVLPRAIGAPLGHQGRSLRCPRPPRTLRSRRARPDPHESPLLCGRRQRQLFSAAGARRLPRGWAAEGLTGQVPGVAAGRSNVARGWARGAPLAGCRFPGRPPDGSGLRRESITYDRYLAGPSSRGSPKRPPPPHTHSQPRALRHTLLTNIMSLWIRAPRNCSAYTKVYESVCPVGVGVHCDALPVTCRVSYSLGV